MLAEFFTGCLKERSRECPCQHGKYLEYDKFSFFIIFKIVFKLGFMNALVFHLLDLTT